MKEYFNANQKLWDAKTPVHLASEFYDNEAFLAGKTSLKADEIADLGDEVAGKSLLHLQCHFGQDTLSWSRMGAKATGIDFSQKAIEQARKLNDQLELDATFVQSNVYDLRENLSGQYDIIYTSYGVTTWLHDLEEWASIINHFLKPGGIFYIMEFHPTLYLFDWDTNKIEFNYFNLGKPYMEMTEGTYADPNSGLRNEEYFWCHSLHETMQPLLKQGLQLTDFKEYADTPYDCFSNLHQLPNGNYQYRPAGDSVIIPHRFSMKMVK
mgnify:CR=1 FL=1